MRMCYAISFIMLIGMSTYAQEPALRTVTQRVVMSAGTPAVNAVVQASCMWRGQWQLRTATTNKNGDVTWTDTPPVRMITWGQNIPAAVIPAEGTEFTTPLPTPQTGESISIAVQLPDKGSRAWCYLKGSANRAHWTEIKTSPVVLSYIGELKEGSLITLYLIALTDPTQTLILNQVYVPYRESRTASKGELKPDWQTGMRVRGTLAMHDGARIPGLSRLVVVPERLEGCPDEFTQTIAAWHELPLTTQEGQGSFTFIAPFPGAYRVMADLYWGEITDPRLKLAVTPGMTQCAVLLPDQVATVPAGADFNWIHGINPARTQTLKVGVYAPKMPVFGPSGDLLAAWYQTAPNTMQLKTRGSDWRTLMLRSVYFNVTDPLGQQINNSQYHGLTLHPPLLGGRRYNEGRQFQQPSLTNTISLPISTPLPVRVELWPGKYLVNNSYLLKDWQALEIPQEGPAEITLAVMPQQFNAPDSATKLARRGIPVLFPKVADTQRLPVVVRFNTGEMLGLSDNVLQDNAFTLPVPIAATSASFMRPGGGVIRDVPLPKEVAAGDPPLVLPPWQPGVAISGRLCSADGMPANRGVLRLINAEGEVATTSQIITDAEGKFSIVNMLPGVYFLTLGERAGFGGWTLTVPEAGLTDLTLTTGPRTGVVGVFSVGSSRSADYWWVPERGTPMRLPVESRMAVTFATLPMPGAVWQVDTRTGASVLIPSTPGEIALGDTLTTTGSSLAISFPWDPSQPLPGAVTLAGTGDRVALAFTFTNFPWYPSSLLGMIAGQIGAIPPGTYKLTVQTPAGAVTREVIVPRAGITVELKFPVK